MRMTGKDDNNVKNNNSKDDRDNGEDNRQRR